MEKYIKHIELINAYINNTLSVEEVKAFEKLLQTNKEFKNLFEEHVIFIKGLERKTLKAEIKNARKSYKFIKLFKTILFSSILIISILLVLNFISNSNSPKPLDLNFQSDLTELFVLKSSDRIVVKGEKGIVILFNSNDLEHKDGKLFTEDSLQIELIELKNQQDLLLANAQTKSNEQWLVSGGAYYIKVKTLMGKELQLKYNKTYKVKFPKYSEEPMELFYGKRNEKGIMNWSPTFDSLTDKTYLTIHLEERRVLVNIGGGVSVERIVLDTTGYRRYTIKNLRLEYPNIKIKDTSIDTLVIKGSQKYASEEIDDLLGSVSYEQILKKELDSIRLEQQQQKIFNKSLNEFYKTVELSKFGWMNVDRFIENELTSLRLKFSVNLPYRSLYLINTNNNTVINIFDEGRRVVKIPKDRNFVIVAVGLKGKQYYGFKKSFYSKKNLKLFLDLKPIKKSHIKELLTL